MGSHSAGSTPATASAQVGDRRFARRYRVIDSTICRPAAADTGDPDPLRAALQRAVQHTDPTTETGAGQKRREVHALADTLRAPRGRRSTASAHRPGPTRLNRGGHRPAAVVGPGGIAAVAAGSAPGTSAAPGVRRRAGSAAPDRGDPEPVAGGVLDQDRHELAGGVPGEPGVRLLHDALHHRWVEHAELHGKSLHHTGNRNAFGTFGTRGGHHPPA